MDSQRQGSLSHFNIYGFCNQQGWDATDEELIAIIRRIEGQGNGKVSFDEFDACVTPITLKFHDLKFVEDQGKNLARTTEINEDFARPFLKTLKATQPLTLTNSVDANLKLYDQYSALQ